MHSLPRQSCQNEAVVSVRICVSIGHTGLFLCSHKKHKSSKQRRKDDDDSAISKAKLQEELNAQEQDTRLHGEGPLRLFLLARLQRIFEARINNACLVLNPKRR